MRTVYFPALAVAARRLGLDDTEMAEAVLCAVGCGADEQEAIRMTLVESLRRKGHYRGYIRQLVDSGQIFQLTESGDHVGREAARKASPVRRSAEARFDGTGTA